MGQSTTSVRRSSPRHHEHELQVACVNAFRMTYPSLSMRLFAVPNGGSRNKAEAARLKAEGVLSGVADLILLKPNRKYGALLIELKYGKNKQSPTQIAWQNDLCSSSEYRYVVVRSVADFLHVVGDYITDSEFSSPTE